VVARPVVNVAFIGGARVAVVAALHLVFAPGDNVAAVRRAGIEVFTGFRLEDATVEVSITATEFADVSAIAWKVFIFAATINA
jgi:hypothetical protein